MRTKNVLLGSLFSVVQNVVVLISGLIIPRLIIGEYGSSINGLISSITQFISYFSLLEAGMAGAAIFALYKPIEKNDQTKINKILSASRRFYYRIGVIYLLATLGFSFVYGFLFSNVLSEGETILLSAVIGFGGALEFITMSRYRVLLTADQKTYVCAIAMTISVLFRTFFIVVLIEVGANIVFIKLISGLTILIRSLILSIYVKKNYPQVSYVEDCKDVVIEQRKDVLLMQILGTVQSAFPIVAMTIVTIPYDMISVYSVYGSVIIGLTTITEVVLNGSIYSTFGEVIQKGEYQLLGKVYGEFETGCYLLFSVLYSCATVLFLPFVRVYTSGVTDIYYVIPSLALVMLMNGYMTVIKYPLSSMIQAGGHYKATRWRTITQFIIGILMPLLFAPIWGIQGIVLGSFCSHLYRTIDVILYVPKKILRTKTNTSLKRISVSLLSMAVVILVENFILPVSSQGYLSWILYSLLYVAISLFVCGFAFFVFCKKELVGLLRRMRYIFPKV